MENGYPGNVDITATYKFDNNNKLHLIYKAKTDKDTILNLTNHTYFNLDGSNNATENSILEHKLIMPNSSFITKINQEGIPTGEFIGTKDTVFDFSKEQAIGSRIDSEDEQIKFAKGYDHNYCIDGYDGKTLIKIAEVTSDKSGITLNVLTNLPGFQFYTANNLGKKTQPAGKDGLRYEKRSSFCIEPQFFPNAINTDSFKEKGILCANEEYNREIIYSFNN